MGGMTATPAFLLLSSVFDEPHVLAKLPGSRFATRIDENHSSALCEHAGHIIGSSGQHFRWDSGEIRRGMFNDLDRAVRVPFAEPSLKRLTAIKGVKGVLVQAVRFSSKERYDNGVWAWEVTNPLIDDSIVNLALAASGSSGPGGCEERQRI
jgi:hypothetical protein